MSMMMIPDDMVPQIQAQMQQRMQMNGGMMQPPMQRQQPMMQPAQPMQQNGPDWIRVSNLQQVEQVNVQPGQTAWIMVQSAPVFAVREADKVGLTTTDYYRFEKFDPTGAQPAQQQANIVSPSEIEQLMARVQALEEEISEAKRRGAITASRKGDNA